MLNELLKEEGIFFTMFFYLWNFFTWGYVPHITFFFFAIIVFFFGAIIIKDYRVIKYVVKDKYLFLKYFIYDFFLEKINFMKSYYLTVRWRISNWNWYAWGITILLLLIVAGALIFAWFYIMDLAQEKALQNISTNISQ